MIDFPQTPYTIRLIAYVCANTASIYQPRPVARAFHLIKLITFSLSLSLSLSLILLSFFLSFFLSLSSFLLLLYVSFMCLFVCFWFDYQRPRADKSHHWDSYAPVGRSQLGVEKKKTMERSERSETRLATNCSGPSSCTTTDWEAEDEPTDAHCHDQEADEEEMRRRRRRRKMMAKKKKKWKGRRGRKSW